MSTIKDVASRANVSIATASRALRGVGYLSNEIVGRVNKAAAELDYIANASAQQLRRGVNNTIGIIISNVNNLFYNKMLASLEGVIRKKGYHILASYSSENDEEELNSFKTMIAAKVHSILFMPSTTQNGKAVRLATSRGIRVIQLFRKVYPDIPAIVMDDERSCYLAAIHLLDHGARRPMLINVRYECMENEFVVPDRANGFLQAMRERSVQDYCVYLHRVYHKDHAALTQAMGAFLPDAVIAANSSFGMDALNAMHQLGLQLQKDIKLVIFDETDWIQYLDISSIQQNLTLLTEAIASKIFEKQEGFAEADYIKVPSDLIIRTSSQ